MESPKDTINCSTFLGSRARKTTLCQLGNMTLEYLYHLRLKEVHMNGYKCQSD